MPPPPSWNKSPGLPQRNSSGQYLLKEVKNTSVPRSMGVTEQSQWHLRRGQYLGEISALCFLDIPPHVSSSPFLLAGTGSQILVYDLVSGEIIRSFEVFQGIRVHGICLENGHKQLADSSLTFRIVVFGEKRVKLFRLHIGSDDQWQPFLNIELAYMQSLPKFGHWVLDVCFLKDNAASSEDAFYLAVGCSDNSLYFWDISRENMFSEVKCTERCLLYSMRMMGNEIESLLVASGTIFNEIIVWKVVCRKYATNHGNHAEHHAQIDEAFLLPGLKYEDAVISRLIGHEGSIFRIAWFSNGLKLVSVSDDRSARIWEIQAEKGCPRINLAEIGDHQLKGPVLFGHNARIWDCCIFDSLIITAGEDCTCRVWDHDGRELNMIKEHTGRGVWRCLYDPNSSLIVTAGFDSAIKVHHFKTFKGSEGMLVPEDFGDRKEVLTLSIPNSSGHGGLIDSKSEYVRCLYFSREDSLYVATNNGYLYHACLFNNGEVKWTELVRTSEQAPIVCMDLLSNCSNLSGVFEDWVAVGDGKGSMTVVLIVGSVWSPRVELTLTWFAERERHLLGTHWCRSLKNRFIFTADPGGRLKLWSLYHDMPSASLSCARSYNACLITEFVSCFGMRIMCVDASFDEEVLVCGDIRGNLLLFSLPRGLLSGTSVAASPSNYFKGAHGVSSVCSVFLAGLCSDQVEIRSTGADGCICYLQHDKNLLNLEFLGMKQVKELSAIRAVFSTPNHFDDSAFENYAIGFASANFIIWNLTIDTKMIQITCGGWRRPHSYYIGDVPEMKICFSFVKDDIIYIHRHWIPKNDGRLHPLNLHIQFHGREIHSLCYISGYSLCDKNQGLVSGSSWIATGCEDGSVRLTRYETGSKAWSISKQLGEHVGGSAVRSISFISKSYMFDPYSVDLPNGILGATETLEDRENPFILISVGAKRVITAWKKINRVSQKLVNTQCGEPNNKLEYNFTCSSASSLSFQWLSTDMPVKYTTYVRRQNIKEVHETAESLCTASSGTISGGSPSSVNREMDFILDDTCENDWRYLDVTAFLVKDARSRISVCFVVVACSDATVTLRALVMPFQLWFDVALLFPVSSPVLSLQHVVIPKLLPSKGNIQFGSVYLVICGSTDGSIIFWDLTECVENFMQGISGLQMENYRETQKRPRTGRGSQGGRSWRFKASHDAKKSDHGILVSHTVSRKKTNSVLVPMEPENEVQNHAPGTSESCLSEQRSALVFSEVREQASVTLEEREDNSIPETAIVTAAHVLNDVHQSGVNCLHVSDIKDARLSDSRFSFYVVSGGDDQAINCVRCDLEINSMNKNSENMTARIHYFTSPVSVSNCNSQCQIQNHQIKFLHLDKITSAHSSAVKGVWTDGSWVFSTGVDQRVRCWKLDCDKLTEFAHLIISVPEPEAMDVNACGRNYYQITVGGRGMQMVEFYGGNGE